MKLLLIPAAAFCMAACSHSGATKETPAVKDKQEALVKKGRAVVLEGEEPVTITTLDTILINETLCAVCGTTNITRSELNDKAGIFKLLAVDTVSLPDPQMDGGTIGLQVRAIAATTGSTTLVCKQVVRHKDRAPELLGTQSYKVVVTQ
jgi:hypothetical protein